MERRAILPAIGLFLLACTTGQAQYTNSYGYTFNNPVSASCNQLLWDSMNSRLIYRTMLQKRGYTDAQLDQMSTEQMLAALGGSAKAQGEIEKPLQGAATSFMPAGEYLLLPDMARSMVADPAQQAALLAIFEQGVTAYEAEAAKSGFVHDLAGAMTYLIGVSYFVFNNGLEPDDNGLELIARALQQHMNTAQVREIADSDKQKFYELMVALATYLVVAYQQGVSEDNQEFLSQMKAGAAEALRGFLSLDPDKVRITSNGLEVAAK